MVFYITLFAFTISTGLFICASRMNPGFHFKKTNQTLTVMLAMEWIGDNGG